MEIKGRPLLVLHTFYKLIGYDYLVDSFIKEMENICVWLAENRFDKEFLKKVIIDLIEYTEIRTNTKLELINLLSK